MALMERIAKLLREPGPPGNQVAPGMPGDVPKKLLPFDEFGVSGLLRTRGVGYVYEEWLADLSTARAKQIYREMRDNDPVIGALFFALEMILRRAEWRVEAAPSKEGEKVAEFVKSCMDDMSHTWEDFVAEATSMFAFGFSLFETVYKRRQGSKGKHTSRHEDGLVGWRKFAPRAQESILYWVWDDEGGLQGAVQLAAPDYRTVTIPIEKLLLFRTTSLKNNPEGRSVLRNCYRPWFFKKRLEEIEGIGIERNLCGVPVLYMSAEALEQMTMNGLTGAEAAKKLVRDIRVDDQAGIVLPAAYDDKGNPLVKLELMRASGGTRNADASRTIGRYNSDILNTMLAGFVQFGQTPTGSRSLHVSATQIFSLAIGSYMDALAAVINRHAIPRLMAMNKMNQEDAPTLKAGDIGVRDLAELGGFVQQMAATGINFTDRPTVEYLRKAARLPDPPEEGEEDALANPLAAAMQGAGGENEPGMRQVGVESTEEDAEEGAEEESVAAPARPAPSAPKPGARPAQAQAPEPGKEGGKRLQEAP